VAAPFQCAWTMSRSVSSSAHRSDVLAHVPLLAASTVDGDRSSFSRVGPPDGEVLFGEVLVEGLVPVGVALGSYVAMSLPARPRSDDPPLVPVVAVLASAARAVAAASGRSAAKTVTVARDRVLEPNRAMAASFARGRATPGPARDHSGHK
jgi:hypothetical protein